MSLNTALMVAQVHQAVQRTGNTASVAYDGHDNDYEPFTQPQWNMLFEKLKSINYRFTKSRIKIPIDDITSMRLNDFISPSEGRVVVVAVNATQTPLTEGIFTATNFPHIDDYANDPQERAMAADQIQKLQSRRSIVADSSARKDPFFIFSWILTNNLESILNGASIAQLALDRAYDHIFWRGLNAFTPLSFPNVLYMDFVGTADWGPPDFNGRKWPATPPAGGVSRCHAASYGSQLANRESKHVHSAGLVYL